MDAGWPSHPGRRARPPAAPKPEDLDKAVRRQQGTRRVNPKQSRVKPAPVDNTQSYQQFYHKVISGQAPQPSSTRQPLFKQPQAAVSSSPALRAKLCPAFDTTQDWTRVQRKLLPKYLFLLDAVTAVHLLKCLVRLQPPAVSLAEAPLPDSTSLPVGQGHAGTVQADQGSRVAVSTAVQHTADSAHQQQPVRASKGLPQLQQPSRRPSLTQLAQLPTSIHAAVAGPIPGIWPAAGLTAAQQLAADEAAVARGYANAAAARAEFEVMLAAVYAVLAMKLPQWPFAVLAKVLGCAGQLQVQHEAFLQAWFAASEPQLFNQPGPMLLSCLEALSRLGVCPPQRWWDEWLAASYTQLPRLSLTQLAALQLHMLHLQQQEQRSSAIWWLSLQSAVLQKVVTSSTQQGSAAQFSSKDTGQEPQGAPQLPSAAQQLAAAVAAAAAVPAAAVTAAAAAAGGAGTSLAAEETDALCTILCTSHYLLEPPPQQWVAEALQLCTAACQQGSVSAAGALQLLAACCCGCGRGQSNTAAAQEAALGLLQKRMVRLSVLGVPIMFDCLQSGGVLEQLPAGFVDELALLLIGVVPGLPTHLLLQVPHVLAVGGWSGQQSAHSERLRGALALATQARLADLGLRELEVLLSGCIGAGLEDMPQVWCVAVLQRVEELRLQLGQGQGVEVGAGGQSRPQHKLAVADVSGQINVGTLLQAAIVSND